MSRCEHRIPKLNSGKRKPTELHTGQSRGQDMRKPVTPVRARFVLVASGLKPGPQAAGRGGVLASTSNTTRLPPGILIDRRSNRKLMPPARCMPQVGRFLDQAEKNSPQPNMRTGGASFPTPSFPSQRVRKPKPRKSDAGLSSCVRYSAPWKGRRKRRQYRSNVSTWAPLPGFILSGSALARGP